MVGIRGKQGDVVWSTQDIYTRAGQKEDGGFLKISIIYFTILLKVHAKVKSILNATQMGIIKQPRSVDHSMISTFMLK
jgi:hypothetical protein